MKEDVKLKIFFNENIIKEVRLFLSYLAVYLGLNSQVRRIQVGLDPWTKGAKFIGRLCPDPL